MQRKDVSSLSRTPLLYRRVVWGPASSVVSTGLTGSSGHPVVEIIDSNTGSVKTTFAGHVRAGQDFSWSKDGKTLASTNSDGNEGALWLWDVGAGRALKTLAHSQQPTKVAWSPDGRILASARHGEVNLWAQPSDKVSKLQGNYYGDWAWSPDSKLLATGSSVGTLDVWDVFSRKLVRSLKIGKEATVALSWSPDGQTLAVFESSTSRMQFWDVGSGKLIREWPTTPFARVIDDLAFSPDGKMLLASSEKGLCFFELTTGKVLLAERGPCSGVATSTEQNVLACGKHDGTIDVWDIDGKKRLRTLEGHVWGVNRVAWSPDGRYLASASDVYHAEGTIRLWEPARGRFLGHLVPLSEAMTLAVTPEGYYRASPRTERELVYVVQTDRGQETLSAEEFAKVHGWKNDPDRVRLLAK
jgi:WD40 repeat protein